MNATVEPLRSCGLNPEDFDVIIIKGVHAPVGAYAEVCPTLIRVNTPGVTTADMDSLPFQNRRKPMFLLRRSKIETQKNIHVLEIAESIERNREEWISASDRIWDFSRIAVPGTGNRLNCWRAFFEKHGFVVERGGSWSGNSFYRKSWPWRADYWFSR